MRLLNEKTVVKLCQLRHSSREGYLLYQVQTHCSECQQSSRQDRKSVNSRPKQKYFRLCGNMLYCLAASSSSLEPSQKLPESVLILQGHVVQIVEADADNEEGESSGDELPWEHLDRAGDSDQSPGCTFQLLWPNAVSCNSCPSCSGCVARHLFTAHSSEEAALWIRALLVASSECVKFTSEELAEQLQQLCLEAKPELPQLPAAADDVEGPSRKNPFSSNT